MSILSTQNLMMAAAGAAGVWALRSIEPSLKLQNGPLLGGKIGEKEILPEIANTNGVPATLFLAPLALAFLIDRYM